MLALIVMWTNESEARCFKSECWISSSQQNCWDNNTYIDCLNTEVKQNKAMEKVLKKELDLPRDIMKKTKLYYNYVDLNCDGVDEIFVLVTGPYTSGSGGSTAFILAQSGKTLVINQKLTLINAPVIISNNIVHGCKEIIIRQSGGGIKARNVVLTCIDGHYTEVNDGREITNLSGVSGTAILCDKEKI